MILDIIIILVFAICIIVGAKKGFAKTVMGLCSYVLSIILGLVFFEPFKVMVYDCKQLALWLESFRRSIAEPIETYVIENSGNLPAFLSTYINSAGKDFAAGLSTKVVEAFLAVVFIILLVAFVKIAAFIIMQIVKLPVLKQFNSLLGGAVGAVNGIILCYIVGAVLVFSLINAGNNWISMQLDSSYLGEYFFKNNLILNLLIGL